MGTVKYDSLSAAKSVRMVAGVMEYISMSSVGNMNVFQSM